MSAFGGVVLPSLLDRGFAEHMRTYFTRETYLAEHVRVQQLKIRMEPPAPYTWDPDPDDGLMRAWAGLSVDVARELVELARWHADEGPTYPHASRVSMLGRPGHLPGPVESQGTIPPTHRPSKGAAATGLPLPFCRQALLCNDSR